MSDYKTVNRGWLKRQVEKGLVELSCSYSYTDFYVADEEANYGRHGFLPAKLGPANEGGIIKEGVIYVDPEDFKSDCGKCYTDEKGVIHFRIHRNLHYTVRIKVEPKKVRKALPGSAAYVDELAKGIRAAFKKEEKPAKKREVKLYSF